VNATPYADLFRSESREQLAAVNRALLDLEAHPGDLAPVHELFRAVHSLKGMSASMGYTGVAAFAHEMEGLLERVRAGALPVRDGLADVLFSAADALDAGVECAIAGSAEPPALSEALTRLRALAAPAPTDDERVDDGPGVLVRVRQCSGTVFPGVRAFMVLQKARALGLSPNDPQSEALLGWAQMLQEKYDEALMNFQKVLMREPANALARINVGYICLKKKIFGEAIEHLSKAIRLDNDKKATLYAHFYLGLVYLEREMYEDAQTFFRKTLALGPNLIEAHYELGRAHWYNGERDEAKQAWSTGHATNKFNPWGKRCAEVLQTVETGGEPPRTP